MADSLHYPTTGGPAFPISQNQDRAMDEVKLRTIRQREGITKRDYFAAAALTGLLASESVSHQDAPQIAYYIADQCLKFRDMEEL